MSIREQILAASDVPSEDLYVFEWKQRITVRGMTAAQREEWERKCDDARNAGTVRALMAVMSCYDADGNRIFEESDAPALAAKSAAPLGRIWDVAIRLNAATKADVEELEGN